MRSIDLKVLVTESTQYMDYIISRLKEHGINVILANTQDPEILRNLATDVDIIVVALAKIERNIIETAKKLRGIVRCGTGVDNIDLQAATERCIPVAYVPDYASNSVAEFTIALIMALARRIIQADKYIKNRNYVQGSWTERPIDLLGIELKERRLGIIGFGRIGKLVAQKGKALGMDILVYDPYVDPEEIKRHGFNTVDLNTLLIQSDFVTIHCPLTEETKHLINEEKLKLMKPTAYLINLARGLIVDEKALYKALKNKWIAGAAIDVYEIEPPPSSNPLFSLDNIITTPHIAFYTEEAITRLAHAVVEEVLRLTRGELPLNLANTEILNKCYK